MQIHFTKRKIWIVVKTDIRPNTHLFGKNIDSNCDLDWTWISPLHCDSVILEEIKQFKRLTYDAFTDFLVYADRFLSNGKSDRRHRPSLRDSR